MAIINLIDGKSKENERIVDGCTKGTFHLGCVPGMASIDNIFRIMYLVSEVA